MVLRRDPIASSGLSPQAEKRLAAMRAGDSNDDPFPTTSDPVAIAEWRAGQHAAWGEGTVDGEVEHRRATIAGIDCLIAGPDDAPTVMHLHAGGFCLGSAGTDAPITARLARHLRVVSVNYRLAPEHPFPAAIEDAEAVYRELCAASGPVAISGISAGGNIAVEVAWRAVDPPPRIALLCPHVDLSGGRRPMLPHEAAYLAGHDPLDAAAAPSEATAEQLGSLPPLLVQATPAEPMWESIERFAVRTGDAGADVTLQSWPDLWHAWHYHRELPEAHAAVDLAAGWLLADT